MTRLAEAGFTLLEVLVALVVLGFLLVGLNRTVGFGLTAWRQDVRLSERKTNLETVDRSLRTIVENFAFADDSARPSIDGATATLAGITRLAVPGSGLVPIRVEVGLGLKEGRLVLRWRPYHHVQPLGSPAPPVETELIDGVARFQIEYWRLPGQWISSWHEPDLPLLIRFHLIFSGPHPDTWPDIVIAPLLSRP